jgi:hypothetical protein
LDLRLDYQREVGRDPSVLFAERIALSGYVHPLPQWSLTAGADYDLANTWIGNADATVRFTSRLVTAQAGVRQYRPHFDLWTIWGAFSPVPYHAAHGTVWVTPVPPLQLRGRWERFAFSAAEVSTALVQVDDDAAAGRQSTYAAGGPRSTSVSRGVRPGASPGVDGACRMALPTTLSAYGSAGAPPVRFSEPCPGTGPMRRKPTDRRDWLWGRAHQEDRERPGRRCPDWNQTRPTAVTPSVGADRSPRPAPPHLSPGRGSR